MKLALVNKTLTLTIIKKIIKDCILLGGNDDTLSIIGSTTCWLLLLINKNILHTRDRFSHTRWLPVGFLLPHLQLVLDGEASLLLRYMYINNYNHIPVKNIDSAYMYNNLQRKTICAMTHQTLCKIIKLNIIIFWKENLFDMTITQYFDWVYHEK